MVFLDLGVEIGKHTENITDEVGEKCAQKIVH